MTTDWQLASTAPDGVDVLVWRQDGFRQDALSGVREVAMYDADVDAWFDGNGDEIGSVRFWTPLPAKPTSEQIRALST